MLDTNNEIPRLKEGLRIIRSIKKKNVQNDQRRQKYAEYLVPGKYTTLEYFQAISHPVGSFTETNESYSCFDYNDDSSVSTLAHNIKIANMCVVCLNSRDTTWVFIPCKHANCCGNCSDTNVQLGQTCPICSSPIENSFQIFLN